MVVNGVISQVPSGNPQYQVWYDQGGRPAYSYDLINYTTAANPKARASAGCLVEVSYNRPCFTNACVAVEPTPTGPFVPATPISTTTNVDTGIVSSTFPAPAPAGFFIPAALELPKPHLDPPDRPITLRA